LLHFFAKENRDNNSYWSSILHASSISPLTVLIIASIKIKELFIKI